MRLWIAIFGIPLCAQTALYSSKEIALGERIAREVLQNSQPVKDTAVATYLQGMCQRLAAKTESPVRFEIVETAEVAEPLGLMGGLVIVPAATLQSTENEAELAGLIGHAIGHAIHPQRVPGPASFGIPFVYWRPHSPIVPLAAVPPIRQAELEMDQFGARLAGDAGFDPSGLEQYLRRTLDATPALQSPFPPKAERLAALQPFTNATGQTVSSEFLQAKEKATRPSTRRAPTLRR